MPDCFISYSSQDEPFARAIHRHLEETGLTVFTAAISLQPGDRWSRTVHKNLDSSDWVIFLASAAACASPYVQQELGRAVGGSKKLIPVVWDQEPGSLPGWVNQHHALDIRGATPEQIAARIGRIAQRIRQDKARGFLVATGLAGGLVWLLSRGRTNGGDMPDDDGS